MQFEEFYINWEGTGTSVSLVLFDSIEYWGTLGPDLVYGSSWGIPSGSVPTDQVNKILQKLPGYCPFFLTKIRVEYPRSNPLISPLPGELYLGPMFMHEVKTNGDRELTSIQAVSTYTQADNRGTNHEYLINRWIDGTVSILPQFSRYAYFTMTFEFDAKKIRYQL